MPLINCKVELKLRWTKYCVLSAAGNDNLKNIDNDNNGNNTIFSIKDIKLFVTVYQEETIKNYQNFSVKDLKDQFIGMNIKQKVRINIQQMNLGILLNQILLELIDYLF